MSNRPMPREHGTPRGYDQHRRRGDLPPCEPCSRAEADRKRPGGARTGPAELRQIIDILACAMLGPLAKK